MYKFEFLYLLYPIWHILWMKAHVYTLEGITVSFVIDFIPEMI